MKNIKQGLAIAAISAGLLAATSIPGCAPQSKVVRLGYHLTKMEMENIRSFIPENSAVYFKRNYAVRTSDVEKIIDGIESETIGDFELMKSNYKPSTKEGYLFFTVIEDYKKDPKVGGYLVKVSYIGENFRDVDLTTGGNLTPKNYQIIMKTFDNLIEKYAIDVE